MDETIIQVSHLTGGFGDATVLEDVSFEVRRGEIFIILGGSGCGKSTLLYHMIGLMKPFAGSILINGKDIVTARGDERGKILSSFGVSFQAGALLGSMTVGENVMLPLREHSSLPPSAAEWIARQKLSLVGLEGTSHLKPSQLSGGMQKRAALARAIALDPDILFLDEPSAGLDPVTAAQLDGLILQLSKTLGATFVIVTHELQSIRTLGGRAIMLDKKTKGIIAQGYPRDLQNDRTNPTVWKFFNRSMEFNPV
ncbi:MAG: ATP-binding cassette domain-containing protein [Planctomycetaceae bacterium]|nr:ATP-binding cassette domain-containing protein [Planctomycetaceae bacterium]